MPHFFHFVYIIKSLCLFFFFSHKLFLMIPILLFWGGLTVMGGRQKSFRRRWLAKSRWVPKSFRQTSQCFMTRCFFGLFCRATEEVVIDVEEPSDTLPPVAATKSGCFWTMCSERLLTRTWQTLHLIRSRTFLRVVRPSSPRRAYSSGFLPLPLLLRAAGAEKKERDW